MIKNIKVKNKNHKELTSCTLTRANKLVKRKRAKWLDENTIILLNDKKDFIRLKKEVFERDNYTCYICKKRLNNDELTVDHVIPKSKGGENSLDNLKCCCRKCNETKGNRYFPGMIDKGFNLYA